MHTETELRFRIEGPGPFREKLRSIGAKCLGNVFERNIVFDNKNRELKNKGELLRLRNNGKFIVTWKSNEEKNTKYKVRKEINMEVSDFGEAKVLFEMLGFFPVHLYEKERETWKLGNLEMLIDKLPYLGWFLEFEGPENKIEGVAKMLGLDMKDGIKDGYVKLFSEHCRRNNLNLKDMVFPKECNS